MIDKIKSVSPLLATRPPAMAPKSSPSEPNDGMEWSRGNEFQLAAPPDMARLKQAEAPQVKAHGLAEIGRKHSGGGDDKPAGNGKS